MIRSNALEEQMKRQRFQAKTLDNLFRRRFFASSPVPSLGSRISHQRV